MIPLVWGLVLLGLVAFAALVAGMAIGAAFARAEYRATSVPRVSPGASGSTDDPDASLAAGPGAPTPDRDLERR